MASPRNQHLRKESNPMVRKRNERSQKEMDDLEWLLESSGKFTTDTSKFFLDNTKLPLDFLKMCVEYLSRSRHFSHANKKNHGTLSTLSNKEQQILQMMSRRKKHNLLCLVRNERQTERKINVSSFRWSIREEEIIVRRTMNVARKIVAEFGRAHLNSLLDVIEGSYDGIGVCPGCHMLFCKDGGCPWMRCASCGRRFKFVDVKLDTEVLRTTKTSKHFLRTKKKSKQEQAKRVLSEHRFLRWLLETAEKILLSSLGANKKNKMRPLLNNENYNEIIESIRYEDNNYHNYKYNDDRRLSCSLPRVYEEGDGGTNDIIFERNDALHSCENDSFSRLKEEALDDEFSFSDYTIGTTPSDSISLCDFIFVSGDNKESLPLHQGGDWEEEFSSSYSLLSGCDSVYSLEDDDVKPKADMVLSYCKVAKLGNPKVAPPLQRPAIKFQNHESKSQQKCQIQEEDACTDTTTSDTSSVAGSYREEEDYDDYWSDPEYNAAKSCHGGRASSRFKGNSRTIPPVNGWGKHRRPNWTRKRRKEYKKSRTYWW